MMAQTAKLAFFFGLMAVVLTSVLQNGWLARSGGEARATALQSGGSAAPHMSASPPAPATMTSRAGVVELTPERNSHFLADIEINGARIRAMVDTGATNVALTAEDARAANIDPPSSAYTHPVQTANGIAYNAPARLREVRIGQIVITDVDAAVARPGQLGISLLGMSFLRKLSSFQVADGRFVMKQ
jgi:aspartyl protease family protein